MVGFTSGVAGGATVAIVLKAVDNYSREFKKLDSSVKKQRNSFQKLGFFLRSTGLGYVAAGGAAATFALKSVQAAIQSERAFQQFNLAVGDTADTLLTDMRRASQGLVSDLDLVNDANRALALGIKENDLPALLEVAEARAKVFGRTTSEAFGDLAIGIGRQSRLILDNLGIIIDMEKAYDEYAQTIGKTADQLTELEKKQALVDKIIKESQGIVRAQIFLQETHAEKIERLKAAYENSKSAVGGFIIDMWDLGTAILNTEQTMAQQIDSVTGIPGTFEEASRAVIDLTNFERDLVSELKASRQEVDNMVNSMLDLKDITFAGERQGDINIAQQKEVVRQLQLREARGEDLTDQLEGEERRLKILRLEQDRFTNEREIQEATNSKNLEERGILESTTFQEFRKSQEGKIAMIETENAKIKETEDKLLEIQDTLNRLTDVFEEALDVKRDGYRSEVKEIDKVINKTNELIEKYKEGASTSSGVSEGRGNFFDRLATKAVSFFGKSNASPNITVNIDKIQGVDENAISVSLASTLFKKLRGI